MNNIICLFLKTSTTCRYIHKITQRTVVTFPEVSHSQRKVRKQSDLTSVVSNCLLQFVKQKKKMESGDSVFRKIATTRTTSAN